MIIRNIALALITMFPVATFALGLTSKSISKLKTLSETATLSTDASKDTIHSSLTIGSKVVSLNEAVANAIEDAKARYNFYNKSIIITKTNVSNVGKSAGELEAFLSDKGYKLLAYGGVSMQLKGFKIIKHSNCFEIIIGTI